jgi:lipid II:glycine glycyltransferase (peptidoglycan interpeptide bridge formation enzyme)
MIKFLDLQKLDSKKEEDVKRAYTVIKANRESKGYPLRMTLEDVLKTIKIIKADFFVLSYNNVDVAAAQIFHVANNIVQIIYWGDIPGYTEIRPMNYLSYKVFEYYYNNKIDIVDIGPSTENGIPNYGLCEFKENIGCYVTNKFTFIV